MTGRMLRNRKAARSVVADWLRTKRSSDAIRLLKLGMPAPIVDTWTAPPAIVVEGRDGDQSVIVLWAHERCPSGEAGLLTIADRTECGTVLLVHDAPIPDLGHARTILEKQELSIGAIDVDSYAADILEATGMAAFR